MSQPQDCGEKKQHCENHENCMKMIQSVIDGSATKEEIEHFKANMDLCQPCIDGYELEKSIKEALNVKLEKKCCPNQTISNIKAKLGLGALLLVGIVIIKCKLINILFQS